MTTEARMPPPTDEFTLSDLLARADEPKLLDPGALVHLRAELRDPPGPVLRPWGVLARWHDYTRDGEVVRYTVIRPGANGLEVLATRRADLVPCPTGDGLYVERRPADPAPAFPNADPPTFEGV